MLNCFLKCLIMKNMYNKWLIEKALWKWSWIFNGFSNTLNKFWFNFQWNQPQTHSFVEFRKYLINFLVTKPTGLNDICWKTFVHLWVSHETTIHQKLSKLMYRQFKWLEIKHQSFSSKLLLSQKIIANKCLPLYYKVISPQNIHEELCSTTIESFIRCSWFANQIRSLIIL